MNIQPDADGNLVFSQRVYDDNGNDIEITSIENTAIDGDPTELTYGAAWLEPAWLVYTISPKAIDLAGGGRSYVDINFTIPADQLEGHTEYQISISFTDGIEAASGQFSIYYEPAPAEVQNLAAAPGAGVKLTWDPNAEADLAGYNVYRSETPGGPYTQLNGALIAAGTEAYTDDTVVTGTTYYYRVRAQDTVGQEGPFSDEVSIEAEDWYVIWYRKGADNGVYYRVSWDLATEQTLIANLGYAPSQLSIDPEAQLVGVTRAASSGDVDLVNFDGTFVWQSSNGWPVGVALDPVNQQHVAGDAVGDDIEFRTYASSAVARSYTGAWDTSNGGAQWPRVDPTNDKVVWHNQGEAALRIAQLSAAGAITVLVSGDAEPVTALDPINQRVFYNSTANADQIHTVDYDGLNAGTLRYTAPAGWAVNRLTPSPGAQGFIYFQEYEIATPANKKLLRMNVNDFTVETVIDPWTDGHVPEDITLPF